MESTVNRKTQIVKFFWHIIFPELFIFFQWPFLLWLVSSGCGAEIFFSKILMTYNQGNRATHKVFSPVLFKNTDGFHTDMLTTSL